MIHDDRRALAMSTTRLMATIDRMGDEAVRAPSRLPEWTVGHVLTHLARNADGNTRMVGGAARGEVLDQYPHGREGRAADIEAGAARPASVIVDDVRRSADGLMAALDALPDDAWDRPVRAFAGEYPVRNVLVARRREVEVHHVDLGVAYTSADWPSDFVARELRVAVDGLAARLDVGVRLELVVTGDGHGALVGSGDTMCTVRGDGASILLWLLGREVPAGGLDAPAGLPTLAPW